MKATQEQARAAVLAPLSYLEANYPERRGWLSLAELRRYLWKAELANEEMEHLVHRLPVHYEDRRIQWRGSSGIVMTDPQPRLWTSLSRRLWVFRLIPFVCMVGVMNSLAAGCATNDSDIDLFVVAKTGRLWMVRAITLAMLTMLGLRTKVDGKQGRLSVDLFVSEAGMDLSSVGLPMDYLLAYWVADFTPVLYPERFRELWVANRWLKDFLPVAYRAPRQWAGAEAGAKPMFVTRIAEWTLRGRMGDVLEQSLKSRQLLKIQKNTLKFNSEQINPAVVITTDEVVKIHFDDAKRTKINQSVASALAGQGRG